VVNRESIQSAYPTTSEDVEGDLQKRWVADELVLFESGQLLPLFMVSYNPPPPPPPRPRKEAKPADISDLDVSNSGFFSDKSAPRPKEMQEIALRTEALLNLSAKRNPEAEGLKSELEQSREELERLRLETLYLKNMLGFTS